MKANEHKEKTDKHELRSLAEFRKRFYPKYVESQAPEFIDPEEVAVKVAKTSLARLTRTGQR